MKCLIVDDEEPARARMRRLLAAHPDIAVAGEARDGLEALEKIDELRPDLLFLDIELPGLSGFEVLRSLPPEVAPPLVIFVTGYDQHALAAFEANALAYLLKPVETERLAQAVLQRIFHQWLQDQRWHLIGRHRLVDIDLHLKPVAEARLLYV